jgi:hypothetical protein
MNYQEDKMDKNTKLDAIEQIYFEKELEAVKARTYDIKYPTLPARTLLPVSYEANTGAEAISYQQFDMVGMAKVVANYANDFPRADIKAKEFVSPVKSLGSSYGYSIQEIRAAAMAGKALQQRRANAAKKAIVQKENDIAMFGDAEYNLPGFLSNPNITTGTVPNDGSGPSTLWVNKTADLILRDMCLAVDAPFNNTKGVEMANTLLMPNEQYSMINCQPRSTQSDKTILEFFKSTHPGVAVMPIWQLASGEYPAALGFSDGLLVAYNRSPDILTLEVPQDFEQFPPDKEGLDFVIHCHQRCGGVIIYYPLACAVYDGI